MVLTVFGAANASMYRTSEAFGSFVPVLANNRRCGLYPACLIFCQRGVASRSMYALYVRCAIAIPNLSFRFSGTFALTATSHRLINTEATDPILTGSLAVILRSMPLA